MVTVVYVQAPDGTPLMPTKRFGKVRKLLKTNEASVVYRNPFTIRLKNEPSGRYTQQIVLGIDPGRTNIGIAAVTDTGTCLFRGKLETRNKEIRALMDERRGHRRASRRGERLAKKRIAVKQGTTTDRFNDCGRILPGCTDPLMLKDIINTESRFNNRKRPEGWLTPSARHLIQTHMSLVRLISKILPINGIAMEINRFAFMELDTGHKLYGDAFQNGRLKGYVDVKDAVYDVQHGKCLLCDTTSIEHYHHIIPKSLGGSNTIRNIAGLCSKCHTLVHTVQEAQEQLLDKHDGLKRQYDGTSLLNISIPFIADKYRKLYPDTFYPVTGTQTYEYRNLHDLVKDHDIDAYVIACVGAGIDGTTPGEYTCDMKQYRNHDRALIKSQTERTYLYDGQVIAKNRKPRFEQKGPALSDWLNTIIEGADRQDVKKILSKVTVKPSQRRYNSPDRHLPGSIFKYKKFSHIMSGQLTGGKYLRAFGNTKTNYPEAKSTFVRNGGGILFV